MSKELTERQIQILDFVQDYSQAHGFPPTIREMGEHFSIAPPSVLSHLKALEKKGVIRREPQRSRSVEILKFKHKAA